MPDHGKGRLPSPPDARDHPLTRYVPRLAEVRLERPAIYHNPRWVYPLDQGATPRCVAYSAEAVRELAEQFDDRRRTWFDPDEFYARCKERDGIPSEAGTYMRTAAQLLLERGMLVRKSASPKNPAGAALPVAAYARLTTLEEVKDAVWLYGSAWLGSYWPDEWDEPIKGGRLAGFVPEPASALDSGHAFYVAGYNDRRGALRCVNSWTARWGQHGRFWVPYEYVEFDRGVEFEAWRTIDLQD